MNSEPRESHSSEESCVDALQRANRILSRSMILSGSIILGQKRGASEILEAAAEIANVDLVFLCMVAPNDSLCHAWKSPKINTANVSVKKSSSAKELSDWVNGRRSYCGATKDAPQCFAAIEEYGALLACKNCIVFPVTLHDKPWGVLGVATVDETRWHASEVEALGALAMLVSCFTHTDMEEEAIQNHIIDTFDIVSYRMNGKWPRC